MVVCWYEAKRLAAPPPIARSVSERNKVAGTRFTYVADDWGEVDQAALLPLVAGDLMIMIYETTDGELWVFSPRLVEVPALDGDDGRTWNITVDDTHLDVLDWYDIEDSPIWDKVYDARSTNKAVAFTRVSDIKELLALWGLDLASPTQYSR